MLKEAALRKLREENSQLQTEKAELSQVIEHLRGSALKKKTSHSLSRSSSRKNSLSKLDGQQQQD